MCAVSVPSPRTRQRLSAICSRTSSGVSTSTRRPRAEPARRQSLRPRPARLRPARSRQRRGRRSRSGSRRGAAAVTAKSMPSASTSRRVSPRCATVTARRSATRDAHGARPDPLDRDVADHPQLRDPALGRGRVDPGHRRAGLDPRAQDHERLGCASAPTTSMDETPSTSDQPSTQTAAAKTRATTQQQPAATPPTTPLHPRSLGEAGARIDGRLGSRSGRQLGARHRPSPASGSPSRVRTSGPIMVTSPAPRVITTSPGRAAATSSPATADQDGSKRTCSGAKRDRGGDQRSGDARLRVLAGGVDLHHHHLVGQPERSAEALGEDPRPAVEVRLERDDQPAGADEIPRGGQVGDELGRVVGVAVDHPDAAHGALELQPSAGPCEGSRDPRAAWPRAARARAPARRAAAASSALCRPGTASWTGPSRRPRSTASKRAPRPWTTRSVRRRSASAASP